MGLLAETIAQVGPLDAAAQREAAGRLWEACPQAAQLGALRQLLRSYIGAAGSADPLPPRACTLIACADHGVARQQVSAYPQATTGQMVRNYLLHRGAAANALADFAGSELLVVDMGMAEELDVPGLIDRHVARGTQDMTAGPAMTRAQAVQAIETGIKLAQTCAADGVTCLLPGEMGIGNTTASAAMAAVLCGLTPTEAAGRGSNISDARLQHKIAVIAQALAVNQPEASDAVDVLAKVGGFEFGCLTGLMLGGAANGVLTILDGFNCGVAALLATALCPAVRAYLLPSQLSREPAHAAVLRKLGLQPLLQMDFSLGEACGSSLVLDFLQAAINIYTNLTLPRDEVVELGDNVTFERMAEETPVVTDRTFGFYLATMPALDQKSLAACRERLDNLTKPVGSLGCLEQIATELAGILFEERPEKDLPRSLLVFTPGELAQGQVRLLDALADYAGAEVTLGQLRERQTATAAFEFGRQVAEEVGFEDSLLGIALARSHGQELRELLLKDDGSLRYVPEEFLRQVPAPLQVEVGAVIGALIAAAHNSCLVVLDDEAVEIIARYMEALCPALRPYMLHVQPAMLHMGIELSGGVVAALGLRVVEAALCILNDMKEFAEVSVNTPQP